MNDTPQPRPPDPAAAAGHPLSPAAGSARPLLTNWPERLRESAAADRRSFWRRSPSVAGGPAYPCRGRRRPFVWYPPWPPPWRQRWFRVRWLDLSGCRGWAVHVMDTWADATSPPAGAVWSARAFTFPPPAGRPCPPAGGPHPERPR